MKKKLIFLFLALGGVILAGPSPAIVSDTCTAGDGSHTCYCAGVCESRPHGCYCFF